MKQARFDRGQLKLDAAKTPEGYLKAMAYVTRTGVFPYERQDGSIIMELRHPDDVFSASALDSLKNIPITVEHQAMVNADNMKRLQVGHVGGEIMPNAPFVAAPVFVTSADGVAAVEMDRKNQLSCGYMTDLVFEPGIYDGQRYDAKQTNIRYNHLALTSAARLGPELSIAMDSALTYAIRREASERRDSTPPPKEQNMIKVTINGIQYDAAPEVARELERMKAEAETAKAKMDADKAKIDGLTAEKDGIKAKLDSADAEKTKQPQVIADAVKARLSLERIAAKVLSAEEMTKLDGKPDLDVKKAVILAKDANAKLDGQTETYVQVRFDLCAETVAATDSAHEALADSRRQSAPRQDNTPATETQDAARARMLERMSNGGKLKSDK